jgi:hypothetical protein
MTSIYYFHDIMPSNSSFHVIMVVSLYILHIVIFFKSLSVNTLIYSHASTCSKHILISIALQEVLLMVLFIYFLNYIICVIMFILLRSIVSLEWLIRLNIGVLLLVLLLLFLFWRMFLFHFIVCSTTLFKLS